MRARMTSSTRGTMVMMVGRTACISVARCSTPREYTTSVPMLSMKNWPAVCS